MKVLFKKGVSPAVKDKIKRACNRLGIAIQEETETMLEVDPLPDFLRSELKEVKGVAGIRKSFPGEQTSCWGD